MGKHGGLEEAPGTEAETRLLHTHAAQHDAVASISDAAVSADGAARQDDLILRAEGLEVDASWGHIFGPVDLSVRSGGVTVLVGHGGRGRTALLLTLAGRMRPTKGSLTAFGAADRPHALFRQAALGFIDEVDEIGQAIRVRDVITEQVRWSAPWYRWVPPATQEDLERICRPVFGDDLVLPTLESMVEELPELTAALLRIAIANVRKPPLLVVGGIDNLTSVKASQELLKRLVVLGSEQTVITADVNGSRHDMGADFGVRDYLPVDNLTNHEFADLVLEEVEVE